LAQIFPEWTNRLPILLVTAKGCLVGVIIFGVWYFGSPAYTDVGYRPVQPIPFSHKMHVDSLEIDCRYCHSQVESSPHANVPPTQTCMNCHRMIKADSEKLVPLQQSWTSGRPIAWTRVHKLPDYAYFNHSAHLSAGIGCNSCHGDIAEMEVVTLAEPLSMSWCLDCHRDPGPHLRRHDKLTNTAWLAPEDQAAFATIEIEQKKIDPPVDCSGCHR